ncbi:PP2C family protein-serine/threonine phosphatase [Streptomyces abikoensis]
MPGTEVVGAAIVDGIGSDVEVAEWARIAAEVAARVGARKTAVLGILAAAELNSAPAERHVIATDGVAVLAVAAPGHPTSIAWTGDARAYGWSGAALKQLTTDHTVGEYLRQNGGGGPIELLAAAHDNWIRTTLGRSSISTVHAAASDDDLVLLTSDGVHDQLPHEELEMLVRKHQGDPQVLAEAIVAAAREDEDGYRDGDRPPERQRVGVASAAVCRRSGAQEANAVALGGRVAATASGLLNPVSVWDSSP